MDWMTNKPHQKGRTIAIQLNTTQFMIKGCLRGEHWVVVCVYQLSLAFRVLERLLETKMMDTRKFWAISIVGNGNCNVTQDMKFALKK